MDNYLERLRRVFVAAAEQRFYSLIPTNHAWPWIPDEVFEPDACYLRVWLNDMYLAHKRFLYQTRCPLVHAACHFNYAGAAQDLQLVVGPGQSENLRTALDHTVNLNYLLLGPVPYCGGDIELLITLVAMEATDYGNQLLDVLGLLSQLTGRGDLKAALPFLQPLKRGVEGLLGIQGLKVHLGVHDTFTYGDGLPNRLTPGYRVVMDVTDCQIDPATLWVRDGRLCSGANLQSATPFEGVDYFLFYLEKVGARGDDSPSLREAWNATIEKAAQSSEQEVDVALNAFKAIVLTSPDLIWSDKQVRIQKLIERVKAIRALHERRGFVPSNFDTSLAGAVAEWQELAGRPGTENRHLSREEIISMSWR